MNDPNGLVRFKGKYHAFYQHYPYKPLWGPMHWAHCVSDDLVIWEHLPIALFPDKQYDYHESEGGCFSGSAIVHGDRLFLFYTGCVKDSAQFQCQCMAYSDDGIHFTKYEQNPVIAFPPPDGSRDFRDPTVWKAGDYFYMAVGTQHGNTGRIVLYRSADIYHWEYAGVFYECDPDETEMCECPDISIFGDRALLIFSSIGKRPEKTLYISGSIDYERGKFNAEKTGRPDWGSDFYAPQTFRDDKGRQLLIAWQNSWGNSIPTIDAGWCGQMTLPREIWLGDDMEMLQKPVDELADYIVSESEIQLEASSEWQWLDGANGETLDISMTCSGDDGAVFELYLRCSEDKKQYTKISIDTLSGTLTADKARSGCGPDGSTSAPLGVQEDYTVRVILDNSTLEVFSANGAVSMSCVIFPDSRSKGTAIKASKKANVKLNIKTLGGKNR